MRRMASMVMVAGLIVGTARADSDVYPTAKELAAKKSGGSSWWPFGSRKKEPVKTERSKPKIEPDKDKAKADASAAKVARPAPDPASVISQERDKFLRRQQVCDKLRQIAHEQSDARLEAQAEALEKQAWNLYAQRVAFAQVAQAAGPDILDTSAAATRLMTPSVPTESRTSTERPVRSITARNADSPSTGKE